MRRGVVFIIVLVCLLRTARRFPVNPGVKGKYCALSTHGILDFRGDGMWDVRCARPWLGTKSRTGAMKQLPARSETRNWPVCDPRAAPPGEYGL
jgi:hypothetical protein